MTELVGVIGTLGGVLVGALIGYRLDRKRRRSEAREKTIIDAASILAAYRDLYRRQATGVGNGSVDPLDDQELHAIELRVQVHCDAALLGLYDNALKAATTFHAARSLQASASNYEGYDEASAQAAKYKALEDYSYAVDRFWAHARQRLEMESDQSADRRGDDRLSF